MRKIYFLLLSLIIFLLVVINAAFIGKQVSTSSSVAYTIAKSHNLKLEAFTTSLSKLDLAIKNLEDNNASTSNLKAQYIATRLKYKEIEYLVSYLDPEFIEDYINGAPLPGLERNSPSLSVLEPEGFQVMEELIFSEEVFHSKVDLAVYSELLVRNAATMVGYQKNIFITDRQIFEAVRNHLVRIFTLGVTGFDSPAALQSIPEAAVSLNAAHEAFSKYYPLIEKQHKALSDSLAMKFNEGIRYLRDNQDFDSFDRMHFLKNFINPLYKFILKAHLALGIETLYETSPLNMKHSVNLYAEDLFANDLLNPFYYTELLPKNYTDELVNLGRTLFFDPILSSNNQRACASCHNPERAFTDGQKKSLAFDHEGTLTRNAPTLINAVYADRYFYDLRTDVLENQIEHVLVDRKELHTSYLEIFEKLKQSEEYVALFQAAFPEFSNSELIMKHTLSSALSAYVVSLSGFNSPFDRYVRGESAEIDPMVISGFNLFMGKAACGTCHFAPVFNGSVPPLYHESETEVLGVPEIAGAAKPAIDPDLGRYKGVLKEEADIYKHSFKTTTVRNVALTAPYMHNGVFSTLEEVVDFYNKGGGIGLGLDVPNQTLPSAALNLDELEVKQLIAFMHALTDTSSMNIKPAKLPAFTDQKLNARIIGGAY